MAPLKGAGLREFVKWLAGSLKRARVEGPSMVPTLREGVTVLYDPGCTDPQVGDVVVARHPRREGFLVVKRVSEKSGSGLVLLGDNPDQSTDSRSFGGVRQGSVLGRVVCTLP